MSIRRDWASDGFPAGVRCAATQLPDLFRHGKDRVRIDGAVVVCKDDAVLAVPIHSLPPTVSAQVIGDAVEGVRFGKGIDAAVAMTSSPKAAASADPPATDGGAVSRSKAYLRRRRGFPCSFRLRPRTGFST